MHNVLVNLLVKLAQQKSVVRLNDCLDMTMIAVDWDVQKLTKQKNTSGVLSDLVGSLF